MNEIILLGNENDKRSVYFLKAAEQLGQSVIILPHCVEPSLLNGEIVKIDPLSYGSDEINSMPMKVRTYRDCLERLSGAAARFLNTPEAILKVLDKREVKHMLLEKGISCTPEIKLVEFTTQALRQAMSESHATGVFLKPNYGSGAAGISVYRFHPSQKEQVLYTTMCYSEGVFHNSKKLYRLNDAEEIERYLSFTLDEKPIVERWLPKQKTVDDFQFDLRVVVQFGRVIYRLARASKSPITNLHLNNHPVDFDDLAISDEKREEIDKLAVGAVRGIDGLNIAGVDIMLTPAEKAYVIEINGQGDLIHKDIYNDNTIYKDQIKGMINCDRC